MKRKITMVYTNKTRHCYFCNKFNAHTKVKVRKGNYIADGYVCDKCFFEQIINKFIKEFGNK